MHANTASSVVPAVNWLNIRVAEHADCVVPNPEHVAPMRFIDVQASPPCLGGIHYPEPPMEHAAMPHTDQREYTRLENALPLASLSTAFLDAINTRYTPCNLTRKTARFIAFSAVAPRRATLSSHSYPGATRRALAARRRTCTCPSSRTGSRRVARRRARAAGCPRACGCVYAYSAALICWAGSGMGRWERLGVRRGRGRGRGHGQTASILGVGHASPRVPVRRPAAIRLDAGTRGYGCVRFDERTELCVF